MARRAQLRRPARAARARRRGPARAGVASCAPSAAPPRLLPRRPAARPGAPARRRRAPPAARRPRARARCTAKRAAPCSVSGRRRPQTPPPPQRLRPRRGPRRRRGTASAIAAPPPRRTARTPPPAPPAGANARHVSASKAQAPVGPSNQRRCFGAVTRTGLVTRNTRRVPLRRSSSSRARECAVRRAASAASSGGGAGERSRRRSADAMHSSSNATAASARASAPRRRRDGDAARVEYRATPCMPPAAAGGQRGGRHRPAKPTRARKCTARCFKKKRRSAAHLGHAFSPPRSPNAKGEWVWRDPPTHPLRVPCAVHPTHPLPRPGRLQRSCLARGLAVLHAAAPTPRLTAPRREARRYGVLGWRGRA